MSVECVLCDCAIRIVAFLKRVLTSKGSDAGSNIKFFRRRIFSTQAKRKAKLVVGQ